MISFVLAVSVLGQAADNGGVLELIGEAAKVEFGGALTLIHDSTEDELVCSGKIRASDVVIQGTTTTVAQMMAEHAMMKDDIAALKQFVGMSSPSPPPSTFSYVGSCGACVGASGGRLQFCHSTGTMSQMQCEETCRGIDACVAISRRFSDHCMIHFDAGFLSQTSDCATLGAFYTQDDWMAAIGVGGSPPAVAGHKPNGPCDWSCYAMDPPTFQWHAGDLAVVGLQTKQAATDSRAFAIAVLREGGIPAGASFFVTDRGVTDACAFSNVDWEGTLQYTAPTALPQGTIITWSGDRGSFVEVESQISESQGTFWLWESGDQLIVYATSSTYDAPPTFIFAVQSTSTQWQSGSSIETDFRVSALPCGLVNGATALTHGKGAGVNPWGAVWYVYTARDCVTQSGCLAAVANANNWVGSDDTSSYAPVAALPQF